jgi:hypothetical protein
LRGTGLYWQRDAVVVHVDVDALALPIIALKHLQLTHSHIQTVIHGCAPDTGRKTDAYGSVISNITRGASTHVNLHSLS